MLTKFKSKLTNIKTSASEESDSKPVKSSGGDGDVDGDDWLSHKLSFVEQGAVLAKDASTKNDDWYDVYDPRNSLNKRKRGDDKHRHREGSSKHRK